MATVSRLMRCLQIFASKALSGSCAWETRFKEGTTTRNSCDAEGMPGISSLGVSAWPITGSSQVSSFRQTPGQSTPSLPRRGKVSVSLFVTFPLMLTNWPALFAPVANPMLNRPSRCIDRGLEEADASVSQGSVTGLLEQAGTCPARAQQVNGAR